MVGVATTALALVSGCAHSGAGKPCAEPPPLRVAFEADARLNADDLGRSLATVVKLLQVKSAQRLEGADFTAVWQSPKEVFAEDLLRVDEFTLDPGQNATHEVPRDPQAQYVVAVGVFRRPSGSAWRAPAALAAVPPERCGPGKGGAFVDARFRFQDARVESLAASQ